MSDFEKVYEAKAAFVHDQLGPLILAATRGVCCVIGYEREAGRETVLLHYKDEPLAVDVTCDSEWAITKDVMRMVSRWYD